MVTVEVTLAVTLAYDFLTTIISLISVIFDNNIFNFVSVLFIKLLILLLSIIVDDGNELFKLGKCIGVLLLLFIHVLYLNVKCFV